MHRSKKRSRVAEPANMPGSFPDGHTPSKRRATASSESGASWLSSYLTSPVRFVQSWLNGTPNKTQPGHQHSNVADSSATAIHELPTRKSSLKHHAAGSVKSSAFPQQQQHQRSHVLHRQKAWSPRRGHTVKSKGARRRKSLVSGAHQQHKRRDRNSELVMEYTSSKANGHYHKSAAEQFPGIDGWYGPDRHALTPVRGGAAQGTNASDSLRRIGLAEVKREQSETPSTATGMSFGETTPNWSLLSGDEESDDAYSTLSIDSSLHDQGLGYKQKSARRFTFGGNMMADQTTSTPPGIYSPSSVNRGRRLLGEDKRKNADVWIVRIRKKIEETLAKTSPAISISTPAYDRARKADGDFDMRLEQARLKMAFTLPKGARAVIERATSRGFTAEINNVPVGDHDMETLGDGKWLNDEVINFYMQLIVSRSEQNPALPKVHAFNTFFYSTLRDQGYARVRRWTRRVNLFEKDMFIVPVHLGVHWCCAVVSFKAKAITYYDSLLGDNHKCLRLLMDYLHSECKDKLGSAFDDSAWTMKCDKDIPRQQNGYDCGIFAATFAEYASRDAPFMFGQGNCPYLRRKMIYEIATKSLISMIV